VVDSLMLLSEIDGLAARGIDVTSRLSISDRAHLVLPYHKLEDQLSEQSAGEGARIGTTSRGIGPCYADKMRRTTAVRFSDLLHDGDLSARVRAIVTSRKAMLQALYGRDVELDAGAILADLDTARDRLGAMVRDTTSLLHELMDAGKTLLFEGANGILLDVDHGTYPFVTSSSTGPDGIGPGAGVSPLRVTCRVGVMKAYATRVGSGPFVTELDDEIGDRIRKKGKEFGTTTGRPRRCGWFDAVSARYAVRLTGVTSVALMHLDTLSGFDEVGICTAYRIDGRTVTTMPADAAALDRAEPVLQFVPGWSEDLRSVRRFEELPSSARSYVERIESLIGAPVSLAGVGPERSQSLVRGELRELIDVPEPAPA